MSRDFEQAVPFFLVVFGLTVLVILLNLMWARRAIATDRLISLLAILLWIKRRIVRAATAFFARVRERAGD